jgi:Na+-driven multidrug efflux pump
VQIGVAAVSIPSVIFLSSHGGFVGIWIALTIYMTVRAIASTWRYAWSDASPFVHMF